MKNKKTLIFGIILIILGLVFISTAVNLKYFNNENKDIYNEKYNNDK